MKFSFAVILVMIIFKLTYFSRGEDIYTEVSFDGGEDVGKHVESGSYIICGAPGPGSVPIPSGNSSDKSISVQ